MTRGELETVRQLKEELRREEGRLQTLRLSIESLNKLLDGMPHACRVASPTERLAAQIVDSERRLGSLQMKMIEEAGRLLTAIKNSPLGRREQEVLILRYVQCMTFRDISLRLEVSDAHVYRLHDAAAEKILQ